MTRKLNTISPNQTEERGSYLKSRLRNFVLFGFYLFLSVACLLIIAKILNPDQVGIFYIPNKYIVIGTDYNPTELNMELVGNNFIPIIGIFTLFVSIGISKILQSRYLVSKKF